MGIANKPYFLRAQRKRHLSAGPTTLILDQFTDTNGTNLTAHTIAPTNTPGNAWLSIGAGIDIQSNKANCTAANPRHHVNAADADVTVSVDLTANAAAGRQGLIMRSLDASNFWFACFSSGAWEITERNAGSPTVRATTAFAITGGQTYALKAVLSGASITATVDGGNSINYGSASFQQTQTFHGIAFVAATNTADNFQVTDP